MANDLQDSEQRRLALDPRQSFIVQAPAGSGKTELLIQRFLIMLQFVDSPDEICAITFTKKAANEMRTRIMKALKHSLGEEPTDSEHAKLTWNLAKKVLARDKMLGWCLLDNPNQLRIQTIDSFCSYLTRQLPLLAHVGAPPDIADTPTLLYEEAVLNVLNRIEEKDEWSADITNLLLHLDNNLNKLQKLLLTLLVKRDQWLPYLHLDTNDNEIKFELEQQLSLVIAEYLQTLTALFPTHLIGEMTTIARYAADQLALNQTDSIIRACQNLTTLPDISPEDKPAWQGIAKILLTETDWRKAFDVRIGFPAASSSKNLEEKQRMQEFKQRAAALVEALHDYPELKAMLVELNYLPDGIYSEAQWKTLKSLLRVLKITAAQLRVTFQQHGQIDFIENAQAAALALGTDEQPTDLALALDYQIKHLLIDEFQDTSLTQYRLLEKLTLGWEQNDGRTLFVVGDPMQSIYRFREAEVGLFIRLRDHGVNQLRLTPLVLSVNFRSIANIVNWNNQQFQAIFPKFNDIATGAINYSPSVAKKLASENTTVNIKGFANPDDHAQANHIVDIISAQLQEHPHKSIAILVRARQHLKTIIPALKKAHIPYRAVEIDPLSERQIIQDLLSLTRALLNPADRIAWLAILRAPWCGLTLADMFLIAGKKNNKTIYEQLKQPDIINTLSEHGRKRCLHLQAIMQANICGRLRNSLRTWVEKTWHALGGPACLQDYSDMDDANVYFQLLDELEQKNELFNLEKLNLKMEKLFAAASNKECPLQLMTIHSAKGLEFDTVILPHLESKGATNDSQLLLWMDRPLGQHEQALVLAPIHATGTDKDSIYTFITRQQYIKSDYELSRLLYVATTRAKEQLHLLFSTRKKESGEYQVESASLLKKLWPALKSNINEYITDSAIIGEELVTKKRCIKRLALGWQNPLKTELAESIAHRKSQGFQLPDRQPQIIGTVTHLLLQQLAQKGVAWWLQQADSTRHQYVKYLLQQQGSTQIETNAIISMLNNVIADKKGVWILHPHQAAQSEFPLTACINDATMNLIIDRTFIDDTGTRWIIDYKTSLPGDMHIDKFIANEKEKYREQLNYYVQAMQMLEERPVRVGLYFTAIPGFWEV